MIKLDLRTECHTHLFFNNPHEHCKVGGVVAVTGDALNAGIGVFDQVAAQLRPVAEIRIRVAVKRENR